MLVQLTMRQVDGLPMPNSPVDGIRIMAQLPVRWQKDLAQAAGDIVIRVRPDETTSIARIRAEVTEILTNPEIAHWQLLTCRALPTRHHERDLAKEENR